MCVIAAKTPSNVSAAFSLHFNLAQTVLDQLTLQLLVDAQDILKEHVFLLISANSKVKLTNQELLGTQSVTCALPALAQVLQTWKVCLFQFATPSVAVIAQWVMYEFLILVCAAVCAFH